MPETYVGANRMRQMISRGGRTLDDAHGQRSIHRNNNLQMEVVQHQRAPGQRRGSVTNFHMHGDALGAVTHTNRRGQTFRLSAGSHNQSTANLTYQAHGRD